ncbi:hypothetical protein SAMN04488128_1021837 [Chitinophaga eiseniae]|uniref:Uncharacterized protein n=1 Tax=Chitinophaga eiseniae TaxID=634771 RepID=A0A1T4S5Z2_9BACT|nr:hypothetical protein SAMN04488128_1021837 [Chitinophaga eiseniae]
MQYIIAARCFSNTASKAPDSVCIGNAGCGSMQVQMQYIITARCFSDTANKAPDSVHIGNADICAAQHLSTALPKRFVGREEAGRYAVLPLYTRNLLAGRTLVYMPAIPFHGMPGKHKCLPGTCACLAKESGHYPARHHSMALQPHNNKRRICPCNYDAACQAQQRSK